MKAKNQISSEADAREKLIIYVYEYLIRANAKQAAQQFLTEIGYDKTITLNNPESQGFLFNWFALFWDLYVSTKTNENKQGSNQVEATTEARAFVDYHMRPVMSPHHQTSPPQPYMNSGSRGYMGGPPPNHSGVPLRPHHGPPPPMNVGPQRVQVGQHLPPPQMGGGPPPQMGGGPPMTHPHGAPMLGMPNGPHHGPSPMMSGAPSPRYTNHPGPITPVPGGPEPGPSPGLVNRMTPNHSGSPHPHMGVVCPPGGPPSGPMHPGMPSHSPMSHPGPPPPPMQQRGGPGPSGWQGGYGSPAEQCFIPGPPGQPGQSNDFGGMMMNDGTNMMEMKPPQVGANNVSNNNSNNNTPANPQQDEYVLTGAYGEPSDQGDDAQIRKIKERLESGDDGDQTGFNMDYGYSAS